MEWCSRRTKSIAEAVWNGGVRSVPVGEEVVASCMMATKFDARKLLPT
jgi:hypothetical protein